MSKPWEQDWSGDSSDSNGAKPWEQGLEADAASAKSKKRTAADIAGDVGVVALKGAIGLPQAAVGLADLAESISPSRIGRSIVESVKAGKPTLAKAGVIGKTLESLGYRPEDAQEMAAEWFSDPQKAANAEVDQAEGFIGTAKAAIQNPSTIAVAAGESLPQMLGGAGIARAATKVAPWLAGAIGEGAMQAGSSAEQARAGNEDGYVTGKQQAAAVGSGVGTAAFGAAGGKIAQRLGIGDVDTLLAGGKLAKSPKGFARQVLESGISEGVFEELPQSIQETMWQNWSEGKPLDTGVGKSAAMGLLTGAAMGGAGGGYNAAASSFGGGQDEQNAAPGAQPGQAPQGQAPAAAGNTGAGTTTNRVSGARESGAAAQAVGVGSTDQAEKALLEPVKLTALDRVNEIDAEAQAATERLAEVTPENGYGPMFDTERAELVQQASELKAEREAITKTWPQSLPGAKTAFSTEAGVKLEGQYAVMDAADLVTSHDEGLRANPLYPQELQPRDRSRSASELQVSSIVQKLDPARLGLSADSATGAPIVGADGLVESGNARTIALKRVYQANGQKAQDYRQFLRDNASQFGIDPGSVDAMQKPVLVRVRATPVNRAEFARQANASTVQRMSTSEQATADAKRLTSLEGLEPDEAGDFMNSRDFIRQFMGTLPVTEQSDMIEGDGRLSTTGYRRIQNAVLAKAYGDSPTLRRMTESLDNNLANVSKALVRVAPTIAAARDRMDAGSLHSADIAPDLLQAVEGLSALKEKGWTAAQELSQTDLTGPKYSPEASDLLQFLSDNIRSPRRIAEFLQRYYEALEVAGDPNQGSIFGDDGPAPTRANLLTAAKGNTDGDQQGNGQPGTDAQVDQENRPGPKDAQGSGRGAQGDGKNQGNASAGQPGKSEGEASEWVMFPPESGTLGIPRAQMPQVKGNERPALIAFLKSRGIDYEKTDVPAGELKPTQAEFSQKKVKGWIESDTKGDRSVLISSDGYVLDGHHQWMGAAAANGDAQVIRFDAPIKELLAVVRAFPGVKQSGGAPDDLAMQRAEAVQGFNDALSDLAAIASKHTRAAMVPENTPDLLPTLTKLFDSAIKLVGTDMKAATRWVKDQLKKDPRFKTFWNKIGPDLYRKAAMAALENPSKPVQGGLFDTPEEASDAVQGDMFDMANMLAEPVVKVAKINGREYDAKRDNFKPPAVSAFMDVEVVSRADGYVDRYYKDRPPVQVSTEDRVKAEALLAPLIKRAEDAKAEYDQKIIDIAKRTGALGQMLAPIKGLKRSVEKLVTDEQFDIGGMKDMLRSTIVVSSYSEAQKVLDEISKEFTLTRAPKNRMGGEPLVFNGASVPSLDVSVFGGYTDLLMNVTMPNGVVAEIQVNVPEMLAAKGDQGHKLYEAQREASKDSGLGLEIQAAMTPFYQAAFDASNVRAALADASKPAGSSEMTSPSRGAPSRPAAMPGRGDSDSPSSDSLNQPLDGKSTNQSPPAVGTNSQPGGKDDGNFIGKPLNTNVPEKAINGYNEPDLFGDRDATAQPRQGDDKAQGSGAVQGNERQGDADAVRNRDGGRDSRSDGNSNTSPATAGEVGQPGARGKRQADEQRALDAPGASTGAVGGRPAGRDIAAKSGLNYAFGADDLTYKGSWPVKAEANVQAVEKLKELQAAGRQANSEEQAVLAKFIGWGASEIANNLFGKKLDTVAEAKAAYDMAIAAMDKLGRDSLVPSGYQTVGYRREYVTGQPEFMEAYRVLKAADPKLDYYTHKEITRDMLNKAKPDAATMRWLALRDRLKKLLTPDEWGEASRSTQYAHYTSKGVVSSMWRAAERMGFAGGTILEPGAGIGVFPGLMPSGMATSSSYTGIEFDAITGGILKQLFPDERILVESFVDSKLPKNFFDVAIGNPPFSATKILGDPEYAKSALSLHDYFFAKSIDRVKPGGLVMYVTSRYTMDKLDDKARKYLSDRADLVGAIRLPQTAFKQNAGTDVITDVIFLRKKVPGQTFDKAQAWGKATQMKVGKSSYPINEYFHAHPEMVLGTPSDTGKMQNTPEPQYTVLAPDGDIETLFDKAVDNLPEGIYTAERGSAAEAAKVREIDFNPKAKKEGNYYVTDAGVLMVREEGVGQRVELRSEKDAQLIKDFVPLRDALKQAHYDQLTDGAWESSLRNLQTAYKAFTKKHGPINQFVLKASKSKVVDDETGETFTDESMVRSFPLLRKIQDDPDSTLVAALETINDDTGEIKSSAFLTGRVLGKPETASINSPADAMLTVLNDVGRVDMGLIANRLGMSEDDAADSLGSAAYNDPESGWQTADEYLSGNVRSKLDSARAAAATDRRFERNVSALEAAQPAPKTPSQIAPGLGENWIPGSDYADFLREVAGVRAEIDFNDITKQWLVKEISGGKSIAATSEFGTDLRNATDILEHALTGRPIRITTTQGAGKDRVTVFDAAGTEAANLKLDQMRDRFASWVWSDSDRSDRLVTAYNDKFNTTVPRSFDGSHLTLPGVSKTMHIFDHVKRGAWRIVQRGNTYLAHAVGSGKTFQMVIAAMEQKRLGLIKKPMIVVPNHMLKQFAHEWQLLYPAARLMVADENNFHTDNRRRFVSRVALSDLDGVVITHSAFKLLDLDPEFKAKMIEEQLDFMRAALDEAESNDKKEGSGRKSPTIKQIEKQIENMEQKLQLAMDSTGKDKNVRFDELGVDQIMVDEAHEYRKLDFTTTRQVKGISPQGSAKAFDLFMKTRYLEEKNPGRSLVMASGTVITNTVAELYSVQKFMDPQALKDRNIEDFDSWAAMFGRERTTLEPDAAGKYTPVTRFTKFVKVPALTQMFREFADVLTSDNLAALLGDKRPKVEGGSREITITPKTETYANYQVILEKRVEESRKWKPTKEEPNNPDPMIRIIGDGRLAAIDTRFVLPGSKSDPDSKLNRMITDVVAKFKETADMEFLDKKTQKPEPNKGASIMVFSDLGFGAGVAASRGFNARAWFEKRLRDEGIPMAQVAFMSDYKKSADKLKLFKDVNAGRVRLLIGSSKNMGTGVNAQQRLKALFHLDSPWYPADLEQREGRIVRQGNKNPLVQIFAYAAKGTYDENMWKMLASKQYFIDQAMSGDANLDEIEDLDSMSSFDMAAAMVAEDPRILQLAGAQAEIAKINRLYQAHEDQRQRFRQQFSNAEGTAAWNEKHLPKAEADAKKVQDLSGDKFTAKVLGKVYTERAKWAEALVAKFDALSANGETQTQAIGEISGFPVEFRGDTVAGTFVTRLNIATPQGHGLHESFDTKPNLSGLAMRAQNAVADVARLPVKMRERLTEARAQMDAVRERLSAPFPMAGMLADKIKEANALEALIKADSAAKASQDAAPAEGEARLSLRNRADDTADLDYNGLVALARRIKSGMPNMPAVNVLPDPSKAPKALREYIIQQDAWNDAEGAMHDGELYLFASGLTSAERAEHVLAEHEAAHFGLRGVLGPALKTAMTLIHAQNASVRKAATAMQKRGKLSNAAATEEVIVDIPSADLVRLKGWRKLVIAARDYLAGRGYDKLAQKLTDWIDGSLTQQQRADLFVADLVRAARAYVAGKAPGRFSVGMGTRLSGTLAEDIAKQEAWLQAEAKARGFKDIEDLLERDYPVFEKLATLWREKNPAESLLSRGYQTQTEAFKKWFGDSKVVDAQGKPLVVYHGTNKDISEFKPGRGSKTIWFSTTPALANLFIGGSRRSMGKGAVPGSAIYPVNLAISKPLDLGSTSPQDNLSVSDVLRMANLPSDDSALRKIAEENLSSGYAFVSPSNKDAAGYLAKQYTNSGIRAANTLDDPGLITALQAAGFDGLKMKEEGATTYAAFRPEQIKSATGNRGTFDGTNPDIRLSRETPATPAKTAAQRADDLINKKAGGFAPIDAIARTLTKVTGVERLTGAIYDKTGDLLNRMVPEKVKAGVISDYGVPEAVIDQRIMLQGRQRVQLRKTGNLIEKLSTLTREESRVAYEWMNMDGADPQAYVSMMHGLPEESVKVLQEVQKMIDDLSKEAVRMGQLEPEAFKRNRFAYLRRSYAKHVLEQTAGDKAKRARVISILGDQYKGRGLVQSEPMGRMQETAAGWWGRKLANGKADTSLKGEKFIRLENRSLPGTASKALPGMAAAQPGKVKGAVYWPAGEPITGVHAGWVKADTWEVRDVKGGNVVLWRDFTKDERAQMGEVDEARFAIAKTLHAMIHDVEVGRYLEWLSKNYAKAEGQTIPGVVVEASERLRDTFAPNEWVQVPDTKIQGTNVKKYGAMAGKYLPGPIWNDLRQVVGGKFQPFGATYAKILTMWKTAKTALSPTVHMNNVMSNFVMADWQDVTASHVGKALRILLAASGTKGGIADSAAALEVVNRYKDSGGDIGSWATQEIAVKQLDPLLAEIQADLAASDGVAMDSQAGVFSALQHALHARFPAALEALVSGKAGNVVRGAGGALIDMYQAEDDVFRLAAWLRAKEEGADDLFAGKTARRSFLDYSINAPWVQAMRQSAWPFISFTYRAVPLLASIAGKKPHKLMKLMMLAGGLNALGLMLAGAGDDDEDRNRKMLPEEKAGRIWGMVPKLIRMPWNDEHGSAVYLDIRRWIPVGDVFDVGQGNAAVPVLPGLMPGGPLVIAGEVVLNKSSFTGQSLTLETDTGAEKATKLVDYLYKAFAPNILGLPGTYATTGVVGSMTGRTDAFGREMSTAQAMASSFGVKLGSYPTDVLRRNLTAKARFELSEIDRAIGQLKRQLATGRIDREEFKSKADAQVEKKVKIMNEVREKVR